MSKIVEQAREYLANNAAESGSDVLIAELCDEVCRMKRWAEIEAARSDQAIAALDKVVAKLAFVSSVFTPDVTMPDGKTHTLKDEIKLQLFEEMRRHLQKSAAI